MDKSQIPHFQLFMTIFAREMDMPLDWLMKLELGGFLKYTNVENFVIDKVFFNECKYGAGSLKEKMATVNKILGGYVSENRIRRALEARGHKFPKE